MSGALIDTSVLIAARDETDLPPSAAISIITLGELIAGVRLARSAAVRRRRQEQLDATLVAFSPLPVDDAVAQRYGDLLAHARSTGRTDKATDLLIAATAAATGRVLHTLDERQASLARSAGLSVA